ncbi:MAG: carbohydrate kinase family protein [Rhodocyclaceae bacterium]
MSILVCGSLAYDTIMVFQDRFKHHILPDQIHILNVSFLVPDMRREFGGCAGNIAYSLHLLGADPLIMATVGDDAASYLARLDELGLRRNHVRLVPYTYTAQAFITTDLDDNQITAFHPGAMMQSHLNRVDDARGVSLGIVAPDGKDGMLAHVERFAANGIPFVLDPGQAMPLFSGAELLECLTLTRYCTLNDYEARLLCERTGLKLERLAAMVDALVVTLGAAGSRIYADGEVLEIPGVAPEQVVDPTGCGDAYRAGLLYGISQGFDWLRTGRLASLMGAIKVASRGGQNHAPSRDEIAERYLRAFGDRPW